MVNAESCEFFLDNKPGRQRPESPMEIALGEEKLLVLSCCTRIFSGNSWNVWRCEIFLHVLVGVVVANARVLAKAKTTGNLTLSQLQTTWFFENARTCAPTATTHSWFRAL